MAREDVNIKVSANVAEAIQLWKAMEKGPEGMANALDAMGQKGQNATKSIGEQVESLAGKWFGILGTLKLVADELRSQAEAIRRIREERVAATNSVDEVWNRFQVQSGLMNGTAADRVRTQLLNTIATRKVSPIQGLMAAEQLGSAGASVADITGGGLDEFLKLITASNAAGREVNVPELARSMVLFLEANGKRPNREGMAGTSLAIQQLFGGTNLQLSNLARFAPEAGTIAKMSGLQAEDQLAIFSQFLGTMDESRASTAFRTGIQRMATAGGTPERVRALAMLGIKPEEIDMQGEDFFAAMERLRKGFGGVSGSQANIAAQKLFGDEGMGFYNVLLQPGALEESKKRGELARDPSGAAARLSLAESSRAAAAREAEALATGALYDRSTVDMDVVVNRMKALVAQLGMDNYTMGHLENTLRDESDFFGMVDVSPEERIRRASLYLERWSGVSRGGLFGTPTQYVTRQQATEYLTGERPIRILGPDGLDIPTEPAATGLSQ